MATVVSGGALARLEPSARNMSFWPSYAATFTDRQLTYATIYRTQPAIRTVVSFLARNLAQLGVHAYRRVGDNDRQRLTDHPAARLLAQPNTRTTGYSFIRALVSDMAIYDAAMSVKLRGEDRTPLGLRRIPPTRIEPLGADWTEPDKIRIHGSAGYLDLDPDRVFYVHGYNPDDARTGCSPIEALRQVLAEEYAASQWREQMWNNGARITGYIERPGDAPEWSPNAKTRFKQDWQAQYAGSGSHVGGTPILEDGMKFVQAGVSPRDAQYVESRKLTREEAAAAYHIPQPMVGILDHATFSNIKEQHKQLYQDTLGPWCAEIEQEYGLQIVPDLPNSRRVYVEFNINEKLQGSFDEQASQLQTAVGGPYMTRNEARGRVNLPHIEGGDELIVPLNVSAGEDPTGDEDPDEPLALPAGTSTGEDNNAD